MRYTLNLEATSKDSAVFELQHDDENRPLHLSFRPSSDVVVLNRMVDGIWADEVRISFPLRGNGAAHPTRVDLVGDKAMIWIGHTGRSFRFQPDCPGIEELKARAINLAWSACPLPEAAEGRMEIEAELFLDLAGRIIAIPHGNEREWAEALVHAALIAPPDLVRFMGSRRFPAQLAVLDLSRDGGFSALQQALLNPRTHVRHLAEDEEAAAFINTLAERNGIANLVAVDEKELGVWLTALDGSTDVLLQGDEVIGRLGEGLAELPETQRARLHLFSNEPVPVPGNTVFGLFGGGATNIRLRSRDWTLEHHATPGARRPGLDVVVAAYNVKNYVVDCVKSLLCEGREDIRVIVVNDGSSDSTETLVAEAFADDQRVVVVSKPNGGCASARNYGRLISDSAHLAFVDADDFVTPNFFADLYDLSLYSGYEITQAGFDFYDDTRKEPYYPTYEEDVFKHIPRESFGEQPVLRLYSGDIIKGQPTIWRKVYRRDFLDARNIYFPENVRAYDDYIFHIVTLTAAGDIWMLPEHKYHYRQHPAQDIKAGDDRHFYMLHMFQMLLRRSIDEGWPNFLPYAQSIMDCIDWSAGKLRPDLVDSFLAATARFCVTLEKVYGEGIMSIELLKIVKHPDFLFHIQREKAAVAHLPGGVQWAYVSGYFQHPDTLRMRQAVPAAS